MKKFAILAVMMLACIAIFIGCQTTDPLATEKSTAISQISTLISEKKESNNYSLANITLMDDILQEAVLDINNATKKQTIADVKQNAIDRISVLLTMSQESEIQFLESAKATVKTQIDYVLEYFNEAEYSADNWQDIMAIYDEKIEQIDEIEDKTAFTNNFVIEFVYDFMHKVRVVDKLTDKYATIYVDLGSEEVEYSVRYRICSNDDYSYDSGYVAYSGIDDISLRLNTAPQKNGSLFIGWYNSLDLPYNFDIIFSTTNPQTTYVIYALWKEIPVAPISGIGEIIGMWTGEYSGSSFLVGDKTHNIITNTVITINEFGVVLIERTYTIEGADAQLAETLFEQGYYIKSDSLTMLCEYRDTDAFGINYNLFYFDNDAFHNLKPNLRQHGMWLEGDTLMFDGHEFAKEIDG